MSEEQAERPPATGSNDPGKDPVFLIMVSGQIESAEVRMRWQQAGL